MTLLVASVGIYRHLLCEKGVFVTLLVKPFIENFVFVVRLMGCKDPAGSGIHCLFTVK